MLSDEQLHRTWAHSGIRPSSTSESGPVGASRGPSDAQNRVLSVCGVYSVSWVKLECSRGLEGRYRLALAWAYGEPNLGLGTVPRLGGLVFYQRTSAMR